MRSRHGVPASAEIVYIDRSRIEAWFDCPRYRYLAYHAEGVGLVAVGQDNISVLLGEAVHRAIAYALRLVRQGVAPQSGDIVNVAAMEWRLLYEEQLDGRSRDAWLMAEQAFLAGALAVNWWELRGTLLYASGERQLVDIEREVTFELSPGLAQMVRCDVIDRNPKANELVYVDFKTTKGDSPLWRAQWERNIQQIANVVAVEGVYGERCAGMQVEGLVKGERKLIKAMDRVVQVSPFVYGFKRGDEVSFTYKAGSDWVRTPAWELVTSPVEWLAQMPTALRSEQLLVVPPDRPTPGQMARWQRQTICNETRIATAVDLIAAVQADGDSEGAQHLLDEHFPMNDKHCRRYGRPCQFEPLCYDEGVAADPLGSGLYKARTPHHETEVGE